ncbi:hypothetical protein CDD82_1533 [Ophiocordyceps australis]|uniref:WSC domain-containing protein n=1 Tax=Ophiocordyceps australis TaxID=1399860 RepID=A0A2C5ZLS9_9HYPO|nr:hypothetical protein CDD82_1533 [Ophiocordyceps australis]
MTTFFFLAMFGFLGVLAQTTHVSPSFTYVGCSKVDLSCFGSPVVMPDGRITPEACQAACKGHHFAALFPDACRCGDDVKAVTPVDESVCNYGCMGDGNLGMCGSVCPAEGPGIANVYGCSSSQVNAPQPVTLKTTITLQSLPPAIDTTCSDKQQPPVTQAAVSGVDSPVSSPDAAITVVSYLTPHGSAPAIPSFASSQQTAVSAASSTCHDSITTAQQVPEFSNVPPVATTSMPEIPAYESTESTPLYATQESKSPSHSNRCYSTELEKNEPSGGASATVANCTSLDASITSETLWEPETSVPELPSESLPVPSQVPESDSSHSFVALPGVKLGALAMVAAMIM